MAEIDKRRVMEKIRIIQECLNKLRTLSQLSVDEFTSDFKNFDSANRTCKLPLKQ